MAFQGSTGGQAGGPAGIDSVARRAGVSTATVSRALRGLPNVSEQTRARVLAAAQELDYVISPSASRLASGQTHSIGVVTPYLGRWFFGQVLSGAEEVLRAAGYDVLLYALPDAASRAGFFARMPLRRRVDGVLVLTLPMEEAEIESLGALGVPIASVGVPGRGVSCVGIDDAAAARVAVNHLINLGHERIALIGGGPSEPIHFTVPHDRLAGYRGAMADAGLSVPEGYEADGAFSFAGGEAAMASLLSLPNPPTAVFAESDEMAMGAMRTIRHSGAPLPRRHQHRRVRRPRVGGDRGSDHHRPACPRAGQDGCPAATRPNRRCAGHRWSTADPDRPARKHLSARAAAQAVAGSARPRQACMESPGRHRCSLHDLALPWPCDASRELPMSRRYVLFAAAYESGPPALDGLRVLSSAGREDVAGAGLLHRDEHGRTTLERTSGSTVLRALLVGLVVGLAAGLGTTLMWVTALIGAAVGALVGHNDQDDRGPRAGQPRRRARPDGRLRRRGPRRAGPGRAPVAAVRPRPGDPHDPDLGSTDVRARSPDGQWERRLPAGPRRTGAVTSQSSRWYPRAMCDDPASRVGSWGAHVVA